MKPCRPNTLPLEAQYLYRRGIQMVSLQRPDAAMNYFQQAVFIAPGFSKAYRELGNCLSLLGREEEASLYRVKASRADPILCNTQVKVDTEG